MTMKAVFMSTGDGRDAATLYALELLNPDDCEDIYHFRKLILLLLE